MPQAINPPFSPWLLLRPAVRVLPDRIMHHVFAQSLRRFHRYYPGVATRLAEISGALFEMNIAEFPCSLYLSIDAGGNMRMQCNVHSGEPDVRVSGTFQGFVHMLEGTNDGDALFFSRSLHVEGDTEALLTLRNAMDSEDIDFSRLLIPSFLHGIAGRLGSPLGTLMHAAQEDLTMLADAIRGNVDHRCQAIEVKQQQNSQAIRQLELVLDKQDKRMQKLAEKASHAEA